MAILLGLTTAFAYGTADFVARFSTRRLGVPGSLLGALLAGAIALSLWLVLRGESLARLLLVWPWLVLPGLLSVAMLALLYSALQRGPVSIASPVVAIHPGLVLILLWATGVRPGAYEWLGLAVILASALLLSTQIDKVGSAQGLPRGHARRTALLAGFAALALALQILSVQHAAAVAGAAAAAWGSRIFALLALLAALPFLTLRRASVGSWSLSLVQGLLDVAAVVALAMGTAGSHRAIVPVVGSAFSAVTVVLARVVLREAMTPIQWLAIGGVLAGIVLLGAAS